MVKEDIKVVGILSENLWSRFSSVFETWNRQKDIILLCDYSEFDILAGHIFNQVIEGENAANVVVHRVLLKKISQEFFREYDMIPKGHKTVCLFEFLDGKIPEIIYKLPVIEGWHQTNKTSLKFQ